MLVKDIMHKPVCIDPNATLAAAARILNERNIGCLPVCIGKEAIGMLTDRDIAMRTLADARSGETMRVREAMSVGVHGCFEDDTTDAAGALMNEAHVRRLVVLDRRRRVVGIVSATDLGGCASQRRPFEIVFFKEIVDHMGAVHRTELMRVSIAGPTEAQAVDDAIRQFEQTRRIGDWRALADGYVVHAMRMA